jgi:DNA-directed RNA polymerase I subunit RPA49
MNKTGDGKGKRKSSGTENDRSPKKSHAKDVSGGTKGHQNALVGGSTKVTGNFDKAGATKDKSKVVLRTTSSQNAYEIGPVLLSATDFAPPRDIEYTLHHQSTSTSGSSSGASMEDKLILAGESDTMDFVAWNFDLNASEEDEEKLRRESRGYAGNYMIGVYDPSNSTVTLRAAPMFSLRRSIKSLQFSSLENSSSTRDWQERLQARRGLGETFGNRKTKIKARNEDRMKVDTSNMADVINTMQEGIEEATENMPDEQTMKEESDQARPIPPPNLLALVPQEAYALHVLIPEEIFRLLNVKFLSSVESASQLGRMLPQGPSHSTWLKDRMWSLIQISQLSHNKQENTKIEFDEDGSQLDGASSTPSILKSSKGRNESRLKLKTLWYIALMWGFVKTVAGRRDKGGEKEVLLKKLKLDQTSSGETILDDLFARFAIVERGSSR